MSLPWLLYLGYAAVMAENLAEGLVAVDPENGEVYRANGAKTAALLREWDHQMKAVLQQAVGEKELEISGLITFHDGFQYFAHAYDLTLLEAIEEEETEA